MKKLLINNRERVISFENNLTQYLESKKFKNNIHVGCGSKILPNFTNIDKYVKKDNIINYDVKALPYDTSSIDLVYSNHMLEHLPFRQNKLALREWFRILRSGGELILGIPDIELIMRKLLDPYLEENHRTWFLYTLFGYQADSSNTNAFFDLNAPDDLGQYHCSGYSLLTIQDELMSLGFSIQEIYNYDGYDTPSIFVKAIKP